MGRNYKCQIEKQKKENVEDAKLKKSGKKRVELQFNTKSGWLKKKGRVHNYPYTEEDNDYWKKLII